MSCVHSDADGVSVPSETEAALVVALEDLYRSAEAVRRMLHNDPARQGPEYREIGIPFTAAVCRAEQALANHFSRPERPHRGPNGDAVGLSAVLRSRGKRNSLHDVLRAADLLEELGGDKALGEGAQGLGK